MAHDGNQLTRTMRQLREYRWLLPAVWVLAGAVASVLLLWGWWAFFDGRSGVDDSAFDVWWLAIAGLGAVGLGVVAALMFRRQVSVETQTAVDRERMVVERSRESRAERGDLHARYQAAAGQLGHETQMLRLSGVYALESLAQEWAALGDRTQRDACIGLLCGYLRTPPTFNRSKSTEKAPVMDGAEAEVRQTIVTVIARHLQDGKGGPGEWSDHDFSFARAWFAHSRFAGSHFLGKAAFDNAHFVGEAVFNSCHFAREAEFDNTRFSSQALFEGSTFAGEAGFNGATFGGVALFDNATFPAIAWFNGATFAGEAWFESTVFSGGAGFDGSTFHGEAGFNGATFSSVALFDNSRFSDVAHFDNVTFTDKTRFSGASMARGIPAELVGYMSSPATEPRH